jgi:putative FmdB family regulatory protein
MPTYLYRCEVHKEFEYEHSIKECLEECPKCAEEKLAPRKVTRLISAGTGFILNGSGWAKDNYSSSK